MFLKVKYFLIATLLLSAVRQSEAQKSVLGQKGFFEPGRGVKKYTSQNGFPLKVINTIAQDKEGLMWFGADDGLARFDGNTFKVFRNDPDNPNSLNDNFVQSIHVDVDGTIWVSSHKGISRYDHKTEQFIHYPSKPDNTNSPVGPTVNQITGSKGGNLWISSFISGFTYLDKKRGKFIRYSRHNLAGLSSAGITSLFEDHEGWLWVGSIDGTLDVFKTDQGIIAKKVEGLPMKNLPSPCRIICFSPDYQGNLWIGTSQGLVFYSRKKNTFSILNKDNSTLKGNMIRTLGMDSRKNLWIGVEDKGLYKLDLTNLNNYSLTDLPLEHVEGEDENLLFKFTFHAVYEDRDQNLWLATNGDGVQMISGIPEKFVRLQRKQSGDYEGVYLRFWGMCSDNEGNLWLGSDGDGIYKYNRQGILLKHYYADGKKGSLTNNAILCAFRDHENALWFGTYAKGLFRYDKRTDTFINYQHNPSDTTSLGGNDIRVIFEDSQHNIWVGCNRGGLNLLHKESGKFSRYIVAESVRAIVEDEHQNLWLGLFEGSPQYFDRKKNTLRPYFSSRQDKNKLSSNIIFALYLDKERNLWMGTGGSGLAKYDAKKDTIEYLDEKKGLGGSTIYALLADPSGNLWMSTNAGISKWDKGEQKFYNYDASHGLQNGKFNSGSFLYDPTSGLMGFAGTEGINFFYPNEIKQNLQPPKVMITGFQLFNQPVEISGTEGILKKAISETKEITLRHNQSVFTFEFTALNYAYPEKCQYAYQMVGFDKSWNFVGTQKMATYTNLDPGEYIFKVKASNNDGIWNEQGTSIRLIITPPFWQTWWFRLLILGSVIGGAVTFFKLRINRIKKQKVVLEKEVEARTVQLKKANEELTEQKEEIYSQAEHIEKLYIEIKDSIRAAEVIQESILPPANLIKDYLPEFFAFYKPRDIVSGDFYWFNVKGDKLFLAIIDCTGHGVSGALMSINGYYLLNLAINSYKPNDDKITASEILQSLDEGISKELNQEKFNFSGGMDIALCVIDKDKRKMEFAGANSPLYIFRSNKLIEIKGDKYPIGGESFGKEKKFTTHNLQLHKDDMIYLFSDGFADQFGGDTGNEKFKYPNFRSLLAEISKDPCAGQSKTLEKNLCEWKRDVQQTDDILVVGFRI